MINLRPYLPAGCKNIAHVQPWHGTNGHVAFNYPLNGKSVPYVSTDPAICADQVAKMILWGIDGINVDYYGPNSPEQTGTLALLKACEAGGLGFSICLDAQAIKAGIDAKDQYIEILSFLAGGMMASPAYLKDSTGRAIVNFFGEPSGIDWNAIRATLPIPMAFLFEGLGFGHAQSDGAYGWVNPTTPPSNINVPAVQAFVAGAAANPAKIAWYPVYAGFDDSIASWTGGRFMTRGLGKTLLDILKLVPTTAQYTLIPTWNDHEEGTGIEEGVTVVSG